MNFPPPELKHLSHRDQLGSLMNDLGLTGPLIEIGTLYGGYAEKLLAGYKGEVHCVDPWVNQPRDVYHDGANLLDMDQVYQHARNTVGVNPRCILVRMMSEDAVKLYPDRSVSGVYIDGNHSLENARRDIAAWFPKVEVGGIFSGHDFYIRYDGDTNSDAQTAILEFALKVGTFPQVNWCNSWYMRVTQEMVARFNA